jgi:hypothetical protein
VAVLAAFDFGFAGLGFGAHAAGVTWVGTFWAPKLAWAGFAAFLSLVDGVVALTELAWVVLICHDLSSFLML